MSPSLKYISTHSCFPCLPRIALVLHTPGNWMAVGYKTTPSRSQRSVKSTVCMQCSVPQLWTLSLTDFANKHFELNWQEGALLPSFCTCCNLPSVIQTGRDVFSIWGMMRRGGGARLLHKVFRRLCSLEFGLQRRDPALQCFLHLQLLLQVPGRLFAQPLQSLHLLLALIYLPLQSFHAQGQLGGGGRAITAKSASWFILFYCICNNFRYIFFLLVILLL